MKHCTLLVLVLIALACGGGSTPSQADAQISESSTPSDPQIQRTVHDFGVREHDVAKAPEAAPVAEEPLVDEGVAATVKTPAVPEGAAKLSYDELVGGARIGFEPIALKAFPEVTYSEFFGRQEPESLDFAEIFVSKLEKRLGAKVTELFLFNGRSTRNSLAFVYHPDETVRGIELTGDASLVLWLNEVGAGFDGFTAHRIGSKNFSGWGFARWNELIEDPTAFAVEHAPSSYKRQELALEKAQYFDFDAVVPNTEHDVKRFKNAFAAFMKARSARASDPDGVPMRKLEAALGVPLPGDFSALYSSTGGLQDVFFGYTLLSPGSVLSEWKQWNDIYAQWSLDDLKSQQSAEPGIHPVYVTPRWVPFVDLAGGNFLAVDLAPVGDAPYGQIITFGADVDGKRHIAASVTELLEKSATYDGSRGHELFSVFGELRL